MLDRRGILKFLMAGAAGTLLTPLPWKLIDDSTVWTQNWPWLPGGLKGEVTWARTSSKLCPTAAGMRVQLVGGRPVRTLPDPEHPLSLGGLSALAASEVQLLYSPARVRAPLLRDAAGKLLPVSYEQALEVFFARLRKIKTSGRADRLLCLCGDETGSISQLLSLLTAGLDSRHCYFMPSDLQPAAQAAHRAGISGLPACHVERSDFILCVGVDILDSWGAAMRHSAFFSRKRPSGRAAALKLVYAGAHRNGAALAADQWLALKPGAEGLFLWTLCQLAGQGLPPFAFNGLSAQEASLGCGTPLPLLRELAQNLRSARQPLVIAGSGLGQGGSAAVAGLGYVLNHLLPGRALTFRPAAELVLAGAVSQQELACRDLYAAGGPDPDLLLTYDANPGYALPVDFRRETGFADIPFKVAFASCLDETALDADLVFPLPFGLERLDDACAPLGCGEAVYSLCPQIVAPPAGIRPAADVLFAALKDLGLSPRTHDGREIGSQEALLRARARQLGASFRALRRGEPHVLRSAPLPPPDLNRLLRAVPAAADLKPEPTVLAVTPLVRSALGTPVSGIPPYSPKLIPASELDRGELLVRLNSQTARSLNLVAGQAVEISAQGNASGRLVLRARLTLCEDLVDGVLGLPLGYGHTGFDDFSNGKGVNGLDLYSVTLKQGRAELAVRGLTITGV